MNEEKLSKNPEMKELSIDELESVVGGNPPSTVFDAEKYAIKHEDLDGPYVPEDYKRYIRS